MKTIIVSDTCPTLGVSLQIRGKRKNHAEKDPTAKILEALLGLRFFMHVRLCSSIALYISIILSIVQRQRYVRDTAELRVLRLPKGHVACASVPLFPGCFSVHDRF